MDWTQVATALSAGVGTILFGIFKYYHSKIEKLEEEMEQLIKTVTVHDLLKDTLQQAKDRIEDKYDPIRERLDRLEDKLDALLSRKK